MNQRGFRRWLAALNRLMYSLLKRGPSPTDPYAYVPAPVRSGPNFRGGAVAVAEPEEPRHTDLLGR